MNDINETAAMTVYETFDERDNPSTRCPVALLLDTSGSMAGEPVEELNRGLEAFIRELRGDEIARFSVDLACVAFGGEPEVILPFTNAAAIDPDCLPRLDAEGLTPMGEAVELGLEMLEERKQQLKKRGVPYYQPWMVLMTDGAPTDDTAAAAARVRQLAAGRKLAFIGIGIGEDADFEELAELCPANRPPKQLRGLDFSAFFE